MFGREVSFKIGGGVYFLQNTKLPKIGSWRLFLYQMLFFFFCKWLSQINRFRIIILRRPYSSVCTTMEGAIAKIFLGKNTAGFGIWKRPSPTMLCSHHHPILWHTLVLLDWIARQFLLQLRTKVTSNWENMLGGSSHLTLLPLKKAFRGESSHKCTHLSNSRTSFVGNL